MTHGFYNATVPAALIFWKRHMSSFCIHVSLHLESILLVPQQQK